MTKQIRGFSFYFCYGTYAGFRFENGKFIKRIVIGRIAFGFMKEDIEQFMEKAFTICDKYKVKKHNKKAFDSINENNKPSNDLYSFDLEGTDASEDEVDYRAIAEEFQRKIYNLEKIIRDNNLEDQLDRQITDEEFICMNGIDTIRTLVFNKTFTKDDINMFDVLYRNLNVIRGIKSNNQKKEKPKSHAELLQLVKNKK